MLLGFISLLLTVSQNSLTKICVPPSVLRHMLPCTLKEKEKANQVSHYSAFSFPGLARRILANEEDEHPKTPFCARKVSFLPFHITIVTKSTSYNILLTFLFRIRFLYYLWKLCITSTSLFLYSPSSTSPFQFSLLFLEAQESVPISFYSFINKLLSVHHYIDLLSLLYIDTSVEALGRFYCKAELWYSPR